MTSEKTKVTNGELLEIQGALSYLTKKETEAWYQIGRNLKKIAKPLEDINDAKKLLFDKYAIKDDNGNIKFKDENRMEVDFGENKDDADKLWQEIKDEEVEVEFYKFNKSILDGEKLNSSAMLPLLDVIIIVDQDK